MPTSVTTLDDAFKKHFGITQVHWSKDSGGQKNVHLITRHGHQCILKIYKNFNERDVREIEIYRKFATVPDIPKLIGIGKYDKDTVSFEEHIVDDCLEDILDRYKANDEKVAKLLTGICTIMTPLWQSKEQIVHRDFKPSNLIIKPDGSPVVIDFGIAKDILASTVTSTGFQPNTWSFASPEQYEHRKDDIQYRTDFFSIAAVGYYLIHGKYAFGNSPSEVARNFKDKSYIIPFSPGCRLIPFFNESLSIAISERPRDANAMIKLLTI